MPPSWRRFLRPAYWRNFLNFVRGPATKSIVRTPARRRTIPPFASRDERPKLSRKSPRKTWSRAEYIHRLERLVAGIEVFEDVEGRRDAIAERIKRCIVDTEFDEDRTKELLEEQGQAVEDLDVAREELQADADGIRAALEDERRRNQPALLPFYFIEQLRRYGDAKDLWVQKRRCGDEWEKKKDVVTAKIEMAEAQVDRKGWQTGKMYLGYLRAMKKGFAQEETLSEICTTIMDDELRLLCKTSAPRCLMDLINATNAGVSPRPDPTTDHTATATAKRTFTDTEKSKIEKDWEQAQSGLDLTLFVYNDKFLSTEQRQKELDQLREKFAQQNKTFTEADEVEFDRKRMKDSERIYNRWMTSKETFKKTRKLAMQAGLEPVEVDTDVGEDDWTHYDDGNVSTFGSYNLRVLAKRKEENEPRIRLWMENVRSMADVSDARAPSSFEDVPRESIIFAETNSVTERATRHRRVAEWRDTCEALREQVNMDTIRPG